jgi:DNA-binding CsgD family transcriptional regulator
MSKRLALSALLRRLSDALLLLYSEQEPERTRRALFAAVQQLIPDSVLTFDRFSLATKTVASDVNEEIETRSVLIAKIQQVMPTHPLIPVAAAGARGALQITDYMSHRQFRETPIYNECLRPYGLKHQIVIPVDVPGHIAGVTVNRNKDFTPQERLSAELLAPHIVRAIAVAQEIADLRQRQRTPVPTPEQLHTLGLTTREAEVLHWVIQGKRDAEIAIILGNSARTVQKHVENILGKLHVETRTAACLLSFETSRQNRVDSIPLTVR